nr:MAG TPA: hypothetical protein [Bacteriophage sp.]
MVVCVSEKLTRLLFIATQDGLKKSSYCKS